ncbi:MAG: hypothetical protein PHX08_03860 [Lachnospiraceae bacterium]|nr:hypothetical protein [Lachnospiraceae bacterium]
MLKTNLIKQLTVSVRYIQEMNNKITESAEECVECGSVENLTRIIGKIKKRFEL